MFYHAVSRILFYYCIKRHALLHLTFRMKTLSISEHLNEIVSKATINMNYKIRITKGCSAREYRNR